MSTVWPFTTSCALCGTDLYRWYYGMRAPLCPWCIGKEGPVLPPDRWRLSPGHSQAAVDIWESYGGAT